jgi:ribosomal protein S18 acetylase RimI-like enzyme
MPTEVTTYYLEIVEPAALVPARTPEEPLEIRQARIPLPDLNRFLYVAVGRDWHWRERLSWSRERWLTYMGRPELETWVAYVRGTPAGYYEQELQPDADAEIVNFGMLPDFVGRGFGGPLLVHAVERGRKRGARRVWLHTCTLDHPRALAHYKARGFRVYDTKTIQREVDAGPRSWP